VAGAKKPLMPAKAGTKVGRAAGSSGAPLTSAAAETNSEEHLYLQVARALKKEIIDGVYLVGTQLPTEDQLCERFSVSRYTVREALRRLREDNLVSSRPRAGTIVVPRPSLASYVQDLMSINDLLAFASDAPFAIDSIRMIAIDDDLASRTGLLPGEEYLAVAGCRKTDGAAAPVCLTECYINRAFAAVGRLLPRHAGPIFPLIEDLFGVSVVEVHQQISAVVLPPAQAAALQVETGTAALEIQRTYKTSEAAVAQVTINTHPGSRFRYSTLMRRVKR